MIVTAHQPHFMPWTGYINRIFLSDTFVVMDNLEYTRNNYISRNRILTRNGIVYLTVPVEYKSNSRRIISEISIDTIRFKHILKKHIETIRHSYSKAPGFNFFFPILASALNNDHVELLSLDLSVLKAILGYLNIDTKVVLASSLNISGDKESDLFIDLCSKTSCNSVLLGLGASTKYVNKEIVSGSGFQILFQKFEHPVYPQGQRLFSPGISVIDLLFNVKREAAENMVKKM